MSQLWLERHQVWIYLAATLAGLGVGSLAPASADHAEALLGLLLAALLYVTFVQIPLLHLRAALTDGRFLGANLLGQFVLVPALVGPLVALLPLAPALQLGVLLVLSMPCTDWFITFTQLGRGDPARALAITPLNLLLQFLLLPLHLWLWLPAETRAVALVPHTLLPAALGWIAVPLLAALLSETWLEADARRSVWRERLALAPVPLLALVMASIAANKADALGQLELQWLWVLPLFLGYLLLAIGLASLLRALFGLSPASGRTLAYGLGTRNSFVVLPLALALPSGFEATAWVIVLQSLIELFGMAAYLRWLPRLMPDRSA